MAKHQTTINELMRFLQEHMATKEDLSAFGKDLRKEMADMSKDLRKEMLVMKCKVLGKDAARRILSMEPFQKAS